MFLKCFGKGSKWSDQNFPIDPGFSAFLFGSEERTNQMSPCSFHLIHNAFLLPYQSFYFIYFNELFLKPFFLLELFFIYFKIKMFQFKLQGRQCFRFWHVRLQEVLKSFVHFFGTAITPASFGSALVLPQVLFLNYLASKWLLTILGLHYF